MVVFIFFGIDVHCPALNTTQNYTISNDHTVRASKVNLTCIEGYYFDASTKMNMKEITCLNSGQWNFDSLKEDCFR